MSEQTTEFDHMTRWVRTSPQFGSAWLNGCCAAFVNGTVCGYPRRDDGTCEDGHPAQPLSAPTHTIGDLRAAARVANPPAATDARCMCGVVDDRGDGTCGNCDLRIMTDDDELSSPPGEAASS